MSDDDRRDRPTEEHSDGDRVGYNGADDGIGGSDNGVGGDDGVGDTDHGSDASGESDDAAESMPLEDLARELGERRQSESEDDLDEAFEPVDVDEVDTDALWEEVFGDDPADEVGHVDGVGDVGSVGGVGEAANGSAVDADRATTGAEHTVSKRDYCQRCPHFSEPPEVACTHGGTEIVEVVTVEQFRVRNCPVVDDE